MIAVAGSILAQIAITALSLSNLSQAHWVARGFFTFSLISAIIAVYYASNQYRVLGRHLNGEDIKSWIRSNRTSQGSLYGSYMPSPAAVLTISAPNMLLSASLNSVLLGFGVYLAYVWKRKLDEEASVNDSRAVFITYVVSLTVCYAIYELSSLVVVRQSYALGKLESVLAQKRVRDIRSEQLRTNEQRVNTQSTTTNDHSSPGPAGTFSAQATHEELIQQLRRSAQLHRDSAVSDERIAQLYERLTPNS